MLFDRVKETADRQGLSLTQLATQAGIGKNAIYTWKPSKQYKNGVKPRTEALQAVADVLGVSVDYLLENTSESESLTDTHSSQTTPSNNLDELLSEEGMAMFDGKPLSEDYKKALLAMLQTMEKRDN